MKKHFLFILLLVLILPAVWALLQSGFFPTHDADWMLIRLTAFHQSLRDGQFPVRWSQRLNHGYGYPIFNFIYPLPFYLGEIVYLASGSFIFSFKLLFALGLIGSAVTMYLWISRRFSPLAGLVAGVIYLYTPYRFVDTYVRGSIGEAVGFIFPPLIFLAIDLLPKKPKLAIILGSTAAAATLLSHNTFFVFVALAFVYGLITLQRKYLASLALTFLLAMLLTAYFWLPALAELKHVSLSQIQVTQISDHLANLRQLFVPAWGYGAVGGVSGFSRQLGLANIGVVIIATFYLLRKKLKPVREFWFFVITFLAVSILIHNISLPLWNQLPAATFLQHPWRLLALTAFASGALAGAVAYKIKPKIISLALATAAVLLTLPYARPQDSRQASDDFFATNEATTAIWNEYLPIWVTQPPSERAATRWEIVNGQAEINSFQETNNFKTFSSDAVTPTTAKLASIYYPGWQVAVNGKPTPIRYQEFGGMIAFDIPPGNSTVKIFWSETPLRKIANSLSLITFISLATFALWQVLERKRGSHSRSNG